MLFSLPQVELVQLPAVLSALVCSKKIFIGHQANLNEALLYFAVHFLYNLYFHPLAKFPGPKRASVSDIWWAKHWTAGKWPYDLEKLHEKYGHVVRIAPNELSFATPQSFQDIYGHANKGDRPFLKTGAFYSQFSGKGVPDIVSILDPKQHSATRKTLSHAFSTKALRNQTGIVLKYVNMWIGQLQTLGTGDDGVDVGEWYNWLTFDIIGDLAFGESFGAVENARTHEWVNIVFNSISLGQYVMVANRMPVIWPVLPFLLPKGFVSQLKRFVKLTSQKVLTRMGKDNSRDDFFSHMLAQKSNDSSEKFMKAQGGILIIAGSETTQTFLTAVTYYLLKYPATLSRLCDEIRGAFLDPEKIDDVETSRLPYLSATIEEGLRLFPPVSTGLPRYSPGATIDGYYVPKGVIVSTSIYATARSAHYFRSSKEFCPERWLAEAHPFYDPRFAKENKNAFKPFSLGSRACLGVNLAYMEMRIILASVLWHFDWELISDDVDWERDSELHVLWSKPKFKVKFTPVKAGVS